MTSKTLIGVGGLLRSGKDTVADHLVKEYGYIKMGMSEPLLDMALILDPIVPTSGGYLRLSEIVGVVGYTQAKQYPEVRRFLQRLGTDVGRNMIDNDLWVNLAMNRIEQHVDDGAQVVLTGVRFPNELNLVKRLNGDTLWVERPDVRQDVSGLHASENSVEQSQFDTTIVNDGTLVGLYHKVDDYMEEA